MGPRRTHRKSRNGCPQCKARRLKCDERYPCTNCAKHNIHCEYVARSESITADGGTPASTVSPVTQPQTQIQGQTQTHGQTPTQTQPQTHHYPYADTPSSNYQRTPDSGTEVEQRLNLLGILPGSQQDDAPIHNSDDWSLDLELMHHFSTVTCNTMAHREDIRHVWRVIFPLEGYANKYLMHGILALAALHRSYLLPNPQQKDKYVKAAAYHISTGLVEFRELIASPLDPKNWQPVFCFTGIINVYLLAVAIRSGTGRWPAPIPNLIEAFASVKGLQALMGPFLHSIRKTQLAPLVNGIWLVDPEIIPSISQTSQSLLPPDTWVQASRLHNLIDNYVFPLPGPGPVSNTAYGERSSSETMNYLSERRKDYKTALESFERSCRATEIAGMHIERGIVFLFAHPLSKQFHDDLEASEPAALIILAHYCVLVQLVDEVWYMDGLAWQLLENIENNLRPGFEEWLVWPKQWVYRRR